jgi:hypothetical protein
MQLQASESMVGVRIGRRVVWFRKDSQRSACRMVFTIEGGAGSYELRR